MHCIQNSCTDTPTPFNKAVAGFTCVLAITVIALSIIGFTAASSGPFNAIVQLGTTTNGVLLGTSIFVLILDLVWIAALYKKTKEQSTVEEINDTDFLSQLPEEIILTVFGYLSMIELTKCTEVSRRWKRLASDETLWATFNPRHLSPLIKVFDESDWVTHVDLSSFGLDVTDAPPLDKNQVISVLKRCLSSLPIEGNAGITLLTIPKGLTSHKLYTLSSRNTPGIHIWGPMPNEIRAVDKTYRIVITNNVLEKSRNLSVGDQKALVNKFGCEMPRLLEATVLLVVTFMESREHLYSLTYTRCSEQVNGFPVVVGGFPVGVPYREVFCISNSRFDDNLYGVGGVLRKF